MSQFPLIFADRILNISVTGPLVRLELATVQPPRQQGEQPTLVPAQTLVMPLEGFVASMGMLDGLMKKLLQDGVIKLNPPEAEAGKSVQ